MSSDLGNLPKVERISYMREVEPVNPDGARYYFVGLMVDSEGQQIHNMSMVVDDRGHGQSWYYCGDDHTVFPINANCPACGRSVKAEKHPPQPNQDGLVQPLNRPETG